MLEALGVQFDPLALPAWAFITGAQAWKMCRAGQGDPDLFGIFEYKGWDFVRGNLLRDLLAVNRVEVLPWDFWGMLALPLSQSGGEVWAACDWLAEALLEADNASTAARELYTEDGALHPPEEWLIP